jgi:proton glutamate symport protein
MQTTQSRKLLVRVLIALVLGVFVGLFVGEYAHYLSPIGDVYIMMLQSVVYPYLISSLVGGFGRMNAETAQRFFKNSWIIYFILVIVSFIVIFALSSDVSNTPSRIIENTGRASSDTFVQNFLRILVPENPFASVVDNFIPAVVLISILYGVALQRFTNKEHQLRFFDLITGTSLNIWNWIIKFSPLGIFALAADFAGRINLVHLEGVLIYIILFCIGTLFLTFCLLPLMIKAAFPIPYRELFFGLGNALVISCATTLSVVALPFIAEMVRSYFKKQQVKSCENEEIVQTSLSISYPLCQLGNFFIYLFLIFALFYFHRNIELAQNLTLPILSFISAIGTPSTSINAVAILTKWLNLPSNALDLYVLLMPLTRFFQVIASVMGMATFTLLSCMGYFRRLHLQLHFLGIGMGILILFIMVFYGLRGILPQTQAPNLMSFHISQDLKKGVPSRVLPLGAAVSSESMLGDTLSKIKKRGVLRVGYNPYTIPNCYFNQDHELVGFDVAYMYKLAQDLHVGLEFIQFEWDDLITDIQEKKFDIAASSIYVTAERLQRTKFTEPYASSQSSLIVRNDKISSFYSLQDILRHEGLKIAVYQDPITLAIAELNFPKDIVLLPNYAFLPSKVDAAVWTKIHTDAWVTVHPGYTSIVPEGLIQGWPLEVAFMLNQSEDNFLQFINYWMKLQKNEGFFDQQYHYWFDRIPMKSTEERWSILKNVLHW